MKAYGLTHTGKVRNNNQDAFIIVNENISSLPNLYIVADGMGGHLAGEVASQTSIKAFCAYINNTKASGDDLGAYLAEAALYANTKVFEDSLKNSEYMGMGTTFTAMTISKNIGYITHIGDSRIYLINNHEIKLLTTDHTYADELIRLGRITKQEALYHPNKHVLTRALGTDEEVKVDTFVFEITKGDKLLMCTDGLSNMIHEDEMKEIVLNRDAEVAINNLIMAANQNGGVDNITSILIDTVGDEYVA